MLVEGSVLDRERLAAIFGGYRVRRVYHLAAYAAEGLSHFIRRFNYENNLIGSVNLINASVNHEVECFVFTSSIAVYGRNQVPMVRISTRTTSAPTATMHRRNMAHLKCPPRRRFAEL